MPGLGTFLMDSSATIELDSKQNKPVNLEGISFESKSSIKDTPELIQFISSQTGKIKALAAADLESHLGLAQQFLNIGKPFLFDGIGSLVKIRSGEYDFTSGQAIYVPALNKESSVKDTSAYTTGEEDVHDYKSVLYPRKTKSQPWRKPVAIILLIGGLGLAIWGGYTVYKRSASKKDETAVADDKKNETVLVEDPVIKQESAPLTAHTASAPAGNYKFILETANAQRAFTRFSRLKTFQWDVQMETRDSLSYKLYMILPASPADTTRLIDSLSLLNGKPVYIE